MPPPPIQQARDKWGVGGEGQTAALKLKVLAGSTVRTSKFTLFHVWTEHMGIVKTSTKFIHQEKSKVTTSLLFKWCSPSGVSSSTSDKCPYTTATKRGPLPEQSNIKRLPLSNTGHISHQHPPWTAKENTGNDIWTYEKDLIQYWAT